MIMRKNKNHKRSKLLPISVIEAASGGNVEAINQVLKHYEGYIVKLSTRQLYDEKGKSYRVVDNEMRRTLETRLITKIISFDFTTRLIFALAKMTLNNERVLRFSER